MKKVWISAISTVLAVNLTAVAVAKSPAPLVSSRYNAQVEVQDLAGLTARLEQITSECQGHIVNFNSDLSSGSGNLNVRVPEEKLGDYIRAIQGLGTLRSQNRSLSDNTSSYMDAKRNLEMAEKMLSAHWTVSGGGLSESEKGLADAEFKAFLRDRVNSYRSTLNGYEQQRGWAELSLSLSGPATQPPVHRHRREGRPEPDAVRPTAPPPAQVSSVDSKTMGMAIFAPSMVLLGLTCMLLVRGHRAKAKPAADSARGD